MTHQRPRSRRIAAALPFVLGVAACAPAIAPGPALLPAGWTPPQGQRCELSDVPRELPSADQVVDSAALAGELGGAAAGSYGLFTVGFDTLRTADTVRLAGGDLPATTRTAWYDAVTRRMRERSPFPVTGRRARPRPWSVLLRLDAGPSPTMRVGRSQHCPPVLTNGYAVQVYVEQAFSQLVRNSPIQQRPARVMMEFVVDSTGMVRDAQVQASTGTAEVEVIARQAIRQARFQPAILNRQAVPVVARMPIIFTVSTPRNQAGGRPPL